MSRRMGPGGRLRPAPRAHRNLPRPEGPRPGGFGVPRATDQFGAGRSAGLVGALDDELAEGTPLLSRPGPHLADFDFDDEMSADDAATNVLGPERDAGTSDDAADELALASGQEPAHEQQGQRFDRRNAGHGPGQGGRPHAERPDRGERPAAPSCTAPQLRRFIKSRAYVPMHELRRRFAIDGGDDDVTGLDLESRRIFVGLPAQEGQLLGDLLRAGEVGFELSMDPRTPVVVGVYAMRPVPRP